VIHRLSGSGPGRIHIRIETEELALVHAGFRGVCVPLYEFECKQCHHRFEKLQRLSDPQPKQCPECGGPVSRLISPSTIQFKGSGWYATDYARKSTASSAPDSKSGAETPAADSKKAKEPKGEGKTAAKTETKTESKTK